MRKMAAPAYATSLFTATKRMVGRRAALQIASASRRSSGALRTACRSRCDPAHLAFPRLCLPSPTLCISRFTVHLATLILRGAADARPCGCRRGQSWPHEPARDLLPDRIVAAGTGRAPAGVGTPCGVLVVGGRGDRQFAADRRGRTGPFGRQCRGLVGQRSRGDHQRPLQN